VRLTTIEETWAGAKSFNLAGRYFRLLETVNPVDIQFGQGLRADENMAGVEAGAWARFGDGFDRLRITTSGSEAVKFIVSDGEAGYDRLFTAFAQARTLTLPGNVAVGVAAGVVLAAATRAKVIFRADAANAGTIYLGPAGLTTATATIALGPGDTWVEEIAASAAWSAIATVAAQTLRVLTAN
jgi:hypothetical protein